LKTEDENSSYFTKPTYIHIWGGINESESDYKEKVEEFFKHLDDNGYHFVRMHDFCAVIEGEDSFEYNTMLKERGLNVWGEMIPLKEIIDKFKDGRYEFRFMPQTLAMWIEDGQWKFWPHLNFSKFCKN
jgi:hypothetical protein